MPDAQLRGVPTVSVGMPVFNEAEHIAATLDAILNQEFADFELLICDNASTDATQAVCAAYARKDSRLRYSRHPKNIGSIANFNHAFHLARGQYFAWASGHDIWRPAFLSRCLATLREDPTVVLCHPQIGWIDAAGTPSGSIVNPLDTRGLGDRISRFNVVLWGLRSGYAIYGLFRSEALRQTSLARRIIAPDHLLLFELSFIGAFAYLPEPLLLARRMPHYGDWASYVGRAFGNHDVVRVLRGSYLRMVLEALRIVPRHVKSWRGRALACLCVVASHSTRYAWIKNGLKRAAEQKARDSIR